MCVYAYNLSNFVRKKENKNEKLTKNDIKKLKRDDTFGFIILLSNVRLN
jgi:hypothetical protein